MFREMRRKRQQLSEAASIEVLQRGTSGVLAVMGDDGYPYAVPLSYVYHDGKLIFHSAAQGHKIDAIARCEKASFCVIDRDEVMSETFTTHFRSVIAFGRAHVIEDADRKLAAIRLLADRYSPDAGAERRDAEISGAMSRLCMIEFEIEHMTGKEAIELVKAGKEG